MPRPEDVEGCGTEGRHRIAGHSSRRRGLSRRGYRDRAMRRDVSRALTVGAGQPSWEGLSIVLDVCGEGQLSTKDKFPIRKHGGALSILFNGWPEGSNGNKRVGGWSKISVSAKP